MATSNSCATPARFSTIDLSLNGYLDDENASFPSLIETPSKRDRNRFIPLQNITTDNITAESNDDSKIFEEDQLLTSHFDQNRSKQERLSSITIIFRLSVIIVLGFIIYFIV
jgi:hypothetical protein